jgi:hypothetical protein
MGGACSFDYGGKRRVQEFDGETRREKTIGETQVYMGG